MLPIGLYLMSMRLIGMYLVSMDLVDVYLIGVHLIDMHLIGVHLTSMYLIGVYGHVSYECVSNRHVPYRHVWACISLVCIGLLHTTIFWRLAIFPVASPIFSVINEIRKCEMKGFTLVIPFENCGSNTFCGNFIRYSKVP
jgi:hypothetical protein